MASNILASCAVSSTGIGRSVAKPFSALLIVSAVFSFLFSGRLFWLAVCFSLMRFTLSCFLNFLRMFRTSHWAFLCFYVADLAFAIGRCVNPGLVNVLVKFSQWCGPQSFTVMKESIVHHDVNSFHLFPVLLGGTVLL